MILDNFARRERYYSFHPRFKKAFSALENLIFTKGRHVIEDDEIIAIHEEIVGEKKEKAKLEAHRKYIDIQYIVRGDETMGWRPIESCKVVSDPYSEEKDILFYSDPPLFFIDVPTNFFVIFSPEDAHAPKIGDGFIQKVIIKVLQ